VFFDASGEGGRWLQGYDVEREVEGLFEFSGQFPDGPTGHTPNREVEIAGGFRVGLGAAKQDDAIGAVGPGDFFRSLDMLTCDAHWSICSMVDAVSTVSTFSRPECLF